MRHREVDPAGLDPRRPGGDATGQPHGRLRAPGDLDVLPREGARDAEAERLPDRLLAGKAPGVALGRVLARVAVVLLDLREAAILEALVAVERAADALDLDQVDADPRHSERSIQSGTCAIELRTASGTTEERSSESGRNLPVRRSSVFIPKSCAPRTSCSRSSVTIHVSSGSASRAASAAAKQAALGFPIT